MRHRVVGMLVGVLCLGIVACGDDDQGSNQNANHNFNQNTNQNTNQNQTICGNNQREGTEQCDGSDLGGESCASLNAPPGSLACTDGCTFDTSGCTGLCGNGSVDLGEQCDGSDFGSETCANNGFTGGNLTCSTACTLDVSTCTGGCGNGVVEGTEQCDPPDGTTCSATCTLLTTTTCTQADSYDPACATATTGQWCWDGGLGGPLFCGCDPSSWGNDDCQVAGYGYCNPATNQCEVPPACGVDANESNDDEATATSLTLGTPSSGAVCAFDPDWFTFLAGDTGAQVLLTWTDDGSTDLDLSITDCAGGYLANGGSTDSAQEIISVAGLSVGTSYCVHVVHYSGPATGTDVSYSLTVTGLTACVLDSQCTAGESCPSIGADAGFCSTAAVPNAGCGDAAPGDNDTSSLAEALSDATPITGEGSCDGHPNGPVDVDWFTFTLASGDHFVLTEDETNFGTTSAQGDVDLLLYDDNGEVVAVSATADNPETISATGLPAGTYFLFATYYDIDTTAAGATTYDLSLTVSAGSGCASRDDCTGLYQRGECSGGLCVPFDGSGGQGPGEFCDDGADCDPNTTGSTYLSGTACFTADPTLGSDNVCVSDCTQESDCSAYGMHCAIVDATSTPPGICLAPCSSDAGCGGLTCNVGTGVCQ